MQEIATMSSILTHPFFQPAADRAAATSYTRYARTPVLRFSSVIGRYAITYAIGDNVHHSLLRENTNGTVDIISENGCCLHRFLDIVSIISAVWNPVPHIEPMLHSEDPQPCMAS